MYEKQTGLKGYEQIIGGGTFGASLETVLWCHVPRLYRYMHQANEFIDVKIFSVQQLFMLRQSMN